MEVCETGPDSPFPSSADAVSALLAVVDRARTVLIVTHNDPDPDSMASAFALAYLLRQRLDLHATIAYGGIIGRAENKAMVRLLAFELQPLTQLDPTEHDVVALVDGQPGAGNVDLPAGVTPSIVIDHHSAVRSDLTEVQFADIREACGATSTILTGYLRAAELTPDRRTATGLFYGIKSDTMGLARAAGEADIEAYLYLLPLSATEILAQIEQAQVPLAYFRAFERALAQTLIYRDVVISDLGPMDWPDLAAEMADFLLRWEGACWIICMGVFDDTLVISVRTNDLDSDAGLVVQDVVGDLGSGGGHGLMAGGRVPLDGRSASEMVRRLRRHFLRRLDRAQHTGEKLV